VKPTNYVAPFYVTFSKLIAGRPSYVQVLSLAPYSQTYTQAVSFPW